MEVPAGYLEAADGRMVGCFYPHASPMLRMFETTNQLKYVENSSLQMLFHVKPPGPSLYIPNISAV
jgi:hypothetical protein